jgi:dihydrodipicolinate synthase/N-acetylneuraminate lyase
MNKGKKYGGVIVPMITPFTEHLDIDIAATEQVVNYIIDSGAYPFILGTTGEAASISKFNKQKLVKATKDASAGRSIIYAGISGNCLHDSIEEGKLYHDMGVTVLVSNMASYYPVSPDQILRYFEALAEAVPCPLILYNIPSTTHISIPLEVVDRLSTHHNIVGLKDSENNIDRLKSAISLWKDRQDFSYLLGWAAMSHRAIILGADGIVPSSGNLVPQLYQALFNASRNKDEEKGVLVQEKTNQISKVYQKDRILSKALPVLKTMMSAYGLCQTHMMPPMYRLIEEEQREIVNTTLSRFGDLKEINNGN